jgi:hypothetical protein
VGIAHLTFVANIEIKQGDYNASSNKNIFFSGGIKCLERLGAGSKCRL